MLMPAAPLLIALLVAFAAGPIIPSARPRVGDLAGPLAEASAAISAAGVAAAGLGLGLTLAVLRRRIAPTTARRRVEAATYLVRGMDLTVYAWVIHGLGWPEFVRSGLGLRGAFLLDDVAILLPFLISEVLGWWGLYPAARLSRLPGTSFGAVAYLAGKARESFGMVLPVVLLFWAGTDLAGRWSGGQGASPIAELAVMAGLVALLPVLSPAFIRLARPSHPLPPGPLRDRLERMARRLGFRFADILVWETEGSLINAGVTGILPGYRYVILSDALIERLDEQEVAAAFGHEIGHLRHRHIPYLAMMLLGSLAVMALVGQAVDAAVGLFRFGRPAADLVRGVAVLGVMVGYYWLAFGALSRRFEGQADVFGCLSVSCGRPDCDRPGHPPHDGYDETEPDPEAGGLPGPESPCPVGVAIYANMLTAVAEEGGIAPDAPAWRYESIARRIALLRRLAGRPDDGRRYQLGVGRLCLAFALALGASAILALLTGAFDGLRGF